MQNVFNSDTSSIQWMTTWGAPTRDGGILNGHQIQILELKIKLRAKILDRAKQRANDMGAVSVADLETEAWREKKGREETKQNSYTEGGKSVQRTHLQLPEGAGEENKTEVFEVRMLGNRQTLTGLETQIGKISISPSRINTTNTICRYITVKPQRPKDQEQRNNYSNGKGWIWIKNMEVIRQWKRIFKLLKESDCSPGILLSAKIAYGEEAE